MTGRYGRRQRYTAIGIRRRPCARCGAKAHAQWNICANGGNFVPICLECDLALNAMVLRWFGFPEAEQMIAEYRGAPTPPPAAQVAPAQGAKDGG